MPLTPVFRSGIETAAGVNFGMMSDGMSIRVVVIREVLQAIADRSVDEASLLAKFDQYRRQFEASPAISSTAVRKALSK